MKNIRLNPETKKRLQLIEPYFSVKELVSERVWNLLGDNAIMLFSPEVLLTLVALRTDPFFDGAQVIMNTWSFKNTTYPFFNGRGFRDLGEDTGSLGSAHRSGEAGDVDVVGYKASVVRERIKSRPKRYKYVRRLEKGVNWVHFDTIETGHTNIIEIGA